MTEEEKTTPPPRYWVLKKTAPPPVQTPDMLYPRVAGEFKTVRRLVNGYSIARFGDGELKMMDGFGYIREEPNPDLAEELKQVAQSKSKNCIIGIPTMNPRGPKYKNWVRHRARFCKYFSKDSGRKFYSSLITRPDSCPWLECQEYANLLTDVWRNKQKVAVVSEPSSKLLTAVKRTNRVIHIECPTYGAYDEIDNLERAVLNSSSDIVLLSCGVTATCLAYRLAQQKVQAIDIGSVGGFLLRWQQGGHPPENYANERANS